jgi:hypothetical protein
LRQAKMARGSTSPRCQRAVSRTDVVRTDSSEGAARRKTQTYGVRGSLRSHGGRLSARHTHSMCVLIFAAIFASYAGPRFRRKCPACDPHAVSGPSPFLRMKRIGRSDHRCLAWTSRSSASSWRGLIVDPGGAPAPPGCRACELGPRVPRPVPLHDAS